MKFRNDRKIESNVFSLDQDIGRCLQCFSLAEGHSWTVNYSRLPFHWQVTKKNVSLGTICGATGNIVLSHFGVHGAATTII